MKKSEGVSGLKIEVVIVCFKRPKQVLKLIKHSISHWNGSILLCHDGAICDDFDQDWLDTRSIVKSFENKENVRVLLQTKNLGVRQSVPSAVSNSLIMNDACIVIEDDLELSSDFFSQMTLALLSFREDSTIMHIAGRREIPFKINSGWTRISDVPVWGWATWKNSWEHYQDFGDHIPKSLQHRYVRSKNKFVERLYWRRLLSQVNEKNTSHWDLNWTLSVFNQGAQTALSPRNLVRYIGNDIWASNTTGAIRKSLLKRQIDENIHSGAYPLVITHIDKKEAFNLSKKMFGLSYLRILEPALALLGLKSIGKFLFKKLLNRFY